MQEVRDLVEIMADMYNSDLVNEVEGLDDVDYVDYEADESVAMRHGDNLTILDAEEMEERMNFGIHMKEIPGLKTVYTDDPEQEYTVFIKEGGLEPDEHGWPVWTFSARIMTDDNIKFDEDGNPVLSGCENANAYWTTSGDHPVLKSLAEKNDDRCRLIHEEQPEQSNYYPVYIENKKKHRCFLAWMLMIHKTKDPEKLRKQYLHFWNTYWRKTIMNEDGTPAKEQKIRWDWLTSKQINSIKEAFAKKGFSSKKK